MLDDRWPCSLLTLRHRNLFFFTLHYITLQLTWRDGSFTTSLGNNGLCWTVFAWNRDTVVPAEGNGDLQTLICVLGARPRRCLILSNPVPWQNWMAAYLGYTLRMTTLFRGWPIMVNDTHTRRRRSWLPDNVLMKWKLHRLRYTDDCQQGRPTLTLTVV